ncbi:MAG: hypothetical protein DWQ06_01650 [Calditrichaeota bacterium]|nr:MAG: hypothetical protein DWQ06_01650 [Calditrichota bacterium]
MSTNRPENVHFVLIPLPRSGAPSPGQPTQVGVVATLFGASITSVESDSLSCAEAEETESKSVIRKLRIKDLLINFLSFVKNSK